MSIDVWLQVIFGFLLGYAIRICIDEGFKWWKRRKKASGKDEVSKALQTFYQYYRDAKPGETGEWITILDRHDGESSINLKAYGRPREDRASDEITDYLLRDK